MFRAAPSRPRLRIGVPDLLRGGLCFAWVVGLVVVGSGVLVWPLVVVLVVLAVVPSVSAWSRAARRVLARPAPVDR